MRFDVGDDPPGEEREGEVVARDVAVVRVKSRCYDLFGQEATRSGTRLRTPSKTCKPRFMGLSSYIFALKNGAKFELSSNLCRADRL